MKRVQTIGKTRGKYEWRKEVVILDLEVFKFNKGFNFQECNTYTSKVYIFSDHTSSFSLAPKSSKTRPLQQNILIIYLK